MKFINAHQQELDEFFILFSYALVYKDWQHSLNENSRGFNIGSILVDSLNNVVACSKNRVISRSNSTQHAETQLIYEYLDSTNFNSLKSFTLYSTLEPCAMCAGMIVMTQVENVIYGQKDVGYGGSFELLNCTSVSSKSGECVPYPWMPERIEKLNDKISMELDSLYTVSLQDREYKHHIIDFLISDAAKQVFEKAYKDFIDYQCRFAQNEEIIEKSKSKFLKWTKK